MRCRARSRPSCSTTRCERHCAAGAASTGARWCGRTWRANTRGCSRGPWTRPRPLSTRRLTLRPDSRPPRRRRTPGTRRIARMRLRRRRRLTCRWRADTSTSSGPRSGSTSSQAAGGRTRGTGPARMTWRACSAWTFGTGRSSPGRRWRQRSVTTSRSWMRRSTRLAVDSGTYVPRTGPGSTRSVPRTRTDGPSMRWARPWPGATTGR